MNVLLAMLGVVLAAVAAGIIVVFLFVPLVKLIAKLVGHVAGTLVAFVTDIFRFVGTVLVLPVFMLLAVASVVFGRWSAAGHYGRAVTAEIRSASLCFYRVVLGHPLRLVGLHALVEGFEKRLPEVVAAAPGPDKPRGRKNQFEGYTIVGSLAGGGSGGRLYIAEPDDLKRAAFEKRGMADVDQVVIKTFSVSEGSTLPQIIRESRALDAAKRLGLILEHSLTSERFYYAMRYIPGEPLSMVTQHAHADAGPDGLGTASLRRMLGFGRDVLLTLDRYHTGGLWHKDIKPDNIIVDSTGAHVVDLGLITPLRSALTLTTHGTEYFRDPELVRMALKGVKVNEVNGEKFDIYAAAAVLFSMVENSFPAHGGLSQITRRCPEAVRWIIRRGMAEYDQRYETSRDMLADLDVVLAAGDPFAVKPAQLPSVSGGASVAASVVESMDSVETPSEEAVRVDRAASPVPPAPEPERPEAPAAAVPPARPSIKVKNWWSGGYAVPADSAPASPDAGTPRKSASRAARHVPVAGRRPAAEQIRNARARAAERRVRAAKRVAAHRSRRGAKDVQPGLNKGVAVAIGVVVGLVSIPLTLHLVPGSGADAAAAIAEKRRTLALLEAARLDTPEAVAHVDGGNAPDAPAAPMPVIAPGASGRVLVVSGFRAPIDPRIEAELRAAVQGLERDGFVTVNNISDTVNDVDELRLLVAMRQAHDLSPSLKDAAKQIRSWFGQSAYKTFDAAVMIAPDVEAIAAGKDMQRVVIADENSAYTMRSIQPDAIAEYTAKAIQD